MPIKSTGCATCRKRKIRCDEKRPGCDRCKVHGVVCGGYRLPDRSKGELAWENVSLAVDGRKRGKSKVQEGQDMVMEVNGVESGGSSSSGSSDSAVHTPEVIWDFNHPIRDDLCFVSAGDTSPEALFQAFGSMESIDLNKAICQAMPTYTGSPTPASTEQDWNDDGLNSFYFVDRNGGPLDITRAAEQFIDPTAMVYSPAVEKQRIYSTFMTTYLPQRIGEQDAHFSFLQLLMQTPNLRPEVSDGLDAMSLVQVGSIFKDKDLLKQAVKSYHKSISGLLKTFTRGGATFATDDYVLATVTILANCEFFDEIAQVGDGWSKHIEGQRQLLAARGPDSVQSNMSLLLYSNMRHGALSHALIVRKECFMGTAEWRRVAWRAPYVDAATIFYDDALQVPGLLERFDRLDVDAENAVEEMDTILEEAKKLEVSMRTWFEDYQIRSRWSQQCLFQLLPLDQFPVFERLVPDRTLKEAYTFPSFMVAYLLCVYWDVMHFLRTMMQKIHIAKYKRLSGWTPDDQDAVEESELREYVLHLCRCFPYFCEPVSSSIGQVGMFLPLRTAAFYFIEHGDWKMLKWTGSVRDNAFVKGMKPPSVRAASNAKRDPAKGSSALASAMHSLENVR